LGYAIPHPDLLGGARQTFKGSNEMKNEERRLVSDKLTGLAIELEKVADLFQLSARTMRAAANHALSAPLDDCRILCEAFAAIKAKNEPKPAATEKNARVVDRSTQ
jgi:hypothetical protein